MQKKFPCACCADAIGTFKTSPANTRDAKIVIICLIDVITCPFKKGERGEPGARNPPLWHYIGGLTSQLTKMLCIGAEVCISRP